MEVLGPDQHNVDPPYVYMVVHPDEYFSRADGSYESLMVYKLIVLMEPITDLEWKNLVADVNNDVSIDGEVTVMPANQAIVDRFTDEILYIYGRLLN